jgi:hypothetical protein
MLLLLQVAAVVLLLTRALITRLAVAEQVAIYTNHLYHLQLVITQ